MCNVRVLAGTPPGSSSLRESIQVTSEWQLGEAAHDRAADMPGAIQPQRRRWDIDALSQDRCTVLIDFQTHAAGKLIDTGSEQGSFGP